MVAVLFAFLAAVLLAVVAGYIANTSHPAIATSGASQSSSTLSDTPTRTLRSGHQTMDGPSSAGPTRTSAGGPAKRFGGV